MTEASSRPIPGGSAELAGRRVARVGYGAMQLEHLRDEPAAAVDLVRLAVEKGVNHVDTAEFYGAGFVNDLLRQALPGGDEVAIATKIGAVTNAGGKVPLRAAQRPEELRASVEDNLRTLGRDHVALVYLRRLDAGPGITATGDQIISVEDQLAVMIAMRDEGKIGGIGLSGATPDSLRTALAAGVAAVQDYYNVIAREEEDLLQHCLRAEVAWVPFFPLGSGFARYEKVTDHAVVRRIATEREVAPAQVALAWLLQHAPNILLVPGTASRAHLEENLLAGALELPADAVAELDAIGR